MGLFDGKAKQEAAENEVMQKLSACPLLDTLMETILQEDEEHWLYKGQSYYDSCRRMVIVEPDHFEIRWSSVHGEDYIGNDGQRHERRMEEVVEQVAYSYTKSGWLPLHSYTYDGGKKEVPTQRVCVLWAAVIRERMAAKLPQCRFGQVNENASFAYAVPKLTFNDWF